MKVEIVVLDLEMSVHHEKELEAILQERYEGKIFLLPVVLETINPIYYRKLYFSNDGPTETGSTTGWSYNARIDDVRALNDFVGSTTEGIIRAIERQKPYPSLNITIHYGTAYREAIKKMILLIKARKLGGTVTEKVYQPTS
jgi:hypothetical protein